MTMSVVGGQPKKHANTSYKATKQPRSLTSDCHVQIQVVVRPELLEAWLALTSVTTIETYRLFRYFLTNG